MATAVQQSATAVCVWSGMADSERRGWLRVLRLEAAYVQATLEGKAGLEASLVREVVYGPLELPEWLAAVRTTHPRREKAVAECY